MLDLSFSLKAYSIVSWLSRPNFLISSSVNIGRGQIGQLHWKTSASDCSCTAVCSCSCSCSLCSLLRLPIAATTFELLLSIPSLSLLARMFVVLYLWRSLPYSFQLRFSRSYDNDDHISIFSRHLFMCPFCYEDVNCSLQNYFQDISSVFPSLL